MQSMNAKIRSQDLLKAFSLMHNKKFDEAEKALSASLKAALGEKDGILAGLCYSAYGVLYKLKKEFRKAWKYYEQAEKFIPDDPALKLISARLLVDYFGQYDTVIRKMDKVVKMTGSDFVFLHQALTIQGTAYLKAGNKKKAVECLVKSMGVNFDGLQSAANLDFKLVNEFVKKRIEAKLCREFLEQAWKFAKKSRESAHEKFIKGLLSAFPAS